MSDYWTGDTLGGLITEWTLSSGINIHQQRYWPSNSHVTHRIIFDRNNYLSLVGGRGKKKKKTNCLSYTCIVYM